MILFVLIPETVLCFQLWHSYDDYLTNLLLQLIVQ